MKKYDSLIKQGKDFVKIENYQEAIKCFEEAFKEKIYINDYINLSYFYIQLENYPKAERILFDVLSYGNFLIAYQYLGYIYEQTNQSLLAIQYYEKFLTEKNLIETKNNKDLIYNDDYISICYSLGVLYDNMEKEYNSEETQKAIYYYKKVIENEPNHFWANLSLGVIYERNGNNIEALHHFQEAYKINPQETSICYNLGVVYSNLGQNDLALNYYLEELNNNDFYPETYYNLGLLYKDVYKDYDKALNAYLNYLKIDKNHYYTWYNLGCLYSIMHLYEKAYDCFLYIYYKDHELFEYIKIDEELEEFRKTEYYNKLLLNNN